MKVRDALVTGEVFDLTRCGRCKFVLTNPRPEAQDSLKYYKSDDYISHTDRKKNLKEKAYGLVKKRMQVRKIQWISKHLENFPHKEKEARNEMGKGFSLLDYGCGTGDFVIAAEKAGFKARGYDPDSLAMQRAQNKGVKTLKVRKDGCLYRSPEFDVITLWHVLEHIPNIREVIASCRKALKPNGIMIVAVPMANSYDALHYKEKWAAWDVPRHLYHFVPGTVKTLFSQEKLECVATYTMPFDALYISLLSEQNRKTERKGEHKPGKNTAGASVIFRAVRSGIKSNLKARKEKYPASSQAFVFKKQ